MGVVVGDSIAMGHPQSSRLFQGSIAYDPSIPNKSGQFSFEFGHLFNIEWYNHGISGQKSSDIWTRWERDVLGNVFDAGDGIGNKTLPNKPDIAYVHVGVNDVFNGITSTVTQDNFQNMAISARDNDITLIMSNVPPRNDFTSTMVTQAQSINSWMSTNLPAYNVILIDEYSWANEGSTSGAVRSDYYDDGIHPNTAGYKALAQFIVNHSK